MFRKYQKVEESELLSPDEHARMEKELHRVGKVSLQETTDDERKIIVRATVQE